VNWQFDPPGETRGRVGPTDDPAGPIPAAERPAARPDVDALFDQVRATSRRRAGRRPWSPDPDGLWSITLQWIVAAAVTLFLAWATYAHGGWVLILSSFDLGVHEFGHLVFFWAPTLMVQSAGSFMQVFLPLVLLAYFLWRRDRFAAILMLAWAAESLNNVSVYIGDAQRMELTLFNDDGSGAGHDWHNILSELHQLSQTDNLAHVVRAVSVLLFLSALGLSLYWLVGSHRARRAR
jgi:hypothetical protein